MARTALTPQNVTSSGLNPTMTAANVDGHSIPLRSGLALVVSNGAASPITITIPTAVTVDGLAVADRAITVANGNVRHMIAIGTEPAYRQSTGVAHIDFSDVTTVTVALVEVP